MEKYLEQLNEAQLAPVLQKDGAMIVIAGAGSGKTRVLTFRIAYLMSQGVDPFNILALTFTNKAAREMKNRIAKIVGASEAKNLWMGTFHSIFAKILRFEADKLGYPSNFTIYDTQDSHSVIRSVIKEMNLDKDVYKYKQVYSRISSYKNSLITVKAYFNNPELMEADAMAKMPRLGDIYKAYVDKCFKAGAMDFDDLLLKTNELLTRFPDVLAKYQNRFRYILVDEYQDTNHSQYLIVRALSDRFQNICVVGDDAQSIYAFRGANINNILNFQKDYDDVKVFRLEQNYRSTKNIVNAANAIIEKNKTRLEKVVWTANDEGNKILVNRTMTDGDEGRFVASSIFENKMNHQLNDGDFAVLYRTNAQSRAIEDALRKKDIPYRIYGGLSFYQRKEIKDVLAYLRLVLNPKDEEALKRVINYPARGIGDTTMERLIVAANHYNRSIFEVMKNIDKIDLKINAGTKSKLEDFVTMIESFQVDGDRVALMTVHLAKGLEFPYVYIVGMEEDLFPSGMNMNSRSELEEERRLFYVALTRAEKQAYLTYTQSRYRWGKLIDAEPSRFIEEIDESFLEYLTPITENRYKPLLDADIFDEVDHSKLRLRKPVAGKAPMGPTEAQLRKLRRLKPVASDTDKNFSVEDTNLSEGTMVEHVRFGKGKILKIEGIGADTKAEIDFENGGLKKLLLRFAKLKVVD